MPKKVMTEDQRLQAMYDRGRAKGRAEAVAAERERIREAVGSMQGRNDRNDWPADLIPRAAVLAIIDPEP